MRRVKRSAVLVALVAAMATPALVVATSGAQSAAHEAHQQQQQQQARAGGGRLRTYFIAADEVTWDYAPQGRNLVTGQAFGETENVFVQRGRDRIGSAYKKALYREYTDASFGTLKPRPPGWQHLGMLGPVIRAEVGDTIRVVFRNNASRPYSVHPHGVFYPKDAEGAGYDDGTSGADKHDDAVPPGETHVYTWQVPPRAGPGPHDGSSVMWMYHSHTDEIGDTYAGLVGAMVVTKKGMAKPDGSPRDVDREFVSVFEVTNENQSPYLDYNIENFAGDPGSVDPDDEGFEESNLMHSINGYVFGSQPLMTSRVGERVRWYMMGMGTEVDLHTPHWHGHTVVAMGMRTDVVSLLPATMVVADMVPDDPGTWLFHCHVNDHIAAGMISRYRVLAA
jgi:hephaestin